VSSHHRHVPFDEHKRKNNREKSTAMLLSFFLYLIPLQSSHLSSLRSLACFIEAARDSRVNSRRAQRVSLRGLTLTHLRILHISRLPLPQSLLLKDIRTYFAVITIAFNTSFFYSVFIRIFSLQIIISAFPVQDR